jgi:phosphatidylglycerophosphatase C
MVMRKIAFFDFDGTITTKDTMFEMIRHQAGDRRFYAGFLANIPVFAALKLKLLSKQSAKEKLLKYFFKGMDFSAFQSGCDTFADVTLPSLVRPDALAEIKKLKESEFEVVVVSASAENWIKKWTDQAGLRLLATQLEVVGEKLTGNLSGLNCNGSEKVVRIRSVYDLSQFDEIYCYGDSGGDKQMLALGTRAFYKPFR